MPRPELAKLIKLKEVDTTKTKAHYFRFLAKLTWDYQEDEQIADRFKARMRDLKSKLPEGIDQGSLQVYRIIGERTVLVIGQARSQLDLQNYYDYYVFKTGIRIEFSHILEVQELLQSDHLKT